MGLDIYFNKVYKTSDEVGYFRKVNFLVEFFQEQKGGEINNLEEFEITKPMAEDLLNRCNKVLENHSLAEELLPTTSGFFFGSTEYDEDYFEDVKDVRNFVEKDLLSQFDNLDDNQSLVFQIWY